MAAAAAAAAARGPCGRHCGARTLKLSGHKSTQALLESLHFKARFIRLVSPICGRSTRVAACVRRGFAGLCVCVCACVQQAVHSQPCGDKQQDASVDDADLMQHAV
jgi:hypothetical protein